MIPLRSDALLRLIRCVAKIKEIKITYIFCFSQRNHSFELKAMNQTIAVDEARGVLVTNVNLLTYTTSKARRN